MILISVSVSKKETGKLRQALKTLSEAEKQLRMSNDKLTSLTAALLQLAPDQQYMLPTSADTSFNHSPLALNNTDVREADRRTNSHVARERRLSVDARMETLYARISADNMTRDLSSERRRLSDTGFAPQHASSHATDTIDTNGRQNGKSRKGQELWLEVLERIQVNGLKEFLYQEAKLISVSFGAGEHYLHYVYSLLQLIVYSRNMIKFFQHFSSRQCHV